MDTSTSRSSTSKPFADVDEGDVPGKNDRDVKSLEFMGYPILIGRNSLSNDLMVRDHEHRDCIWFHAVCGKGAHVVLCINGRDYPAMVVLRRVADYALKYSKSLVKEVSYSPLADVYKPQTQMTGVWKTWRSDTIKL